MKPGQEPTELGRELLLAGALLALAIAGLCVVAAAAPGRRRVATADYDAALKERVDRLQDHCAGVAGELAEVYEEAEVAIDIAAQTDAVIEEIDDLLPGLPKALLDRDPNRDEIVRRADEELARSAADRAAKEHLDEPTFRIPHPGPDEPTP